MAEFRFKLYRTEIRQGEVSVQANSFTEAAAKAAGVQDLKIPRGCRMLHAFNQDIEPSVAVEIVSGREVR